jgi:hypothetical protein
MVVSKMFSTRKLAAGEPARGSGHSYTGAVTAGASNECVLSLTDNTTKSPFTTTQVDKRARNAAVEWIW